MKIHSRYDRPACPGVSFPEPTHTQIHFQQECDINTIIQRAIRSGDMSALTPDERGQFYDCTTMGDFEASVHFMKECENDFRTLPSDIRRRFNDDLRTYLAFMADSENTLEAIDLGLLTRRAPEAKPTSPAPKSGGADDDGLPV